jgi:hypothetical protein
MMQALTAFLDVFCDGTVRTRSLQKLNLIGAHLEKTRHHPFPFHFFPFVGFHAKHGRITGFRLRQIGDGYSEVVDVFEEWGSQTGKRV